MYVYVYVTYLSCTAAASCVVPVSSARGNASMSRGMSLDSTVSTSSMRRCLSPWNLEKS